MGIGSGEEHTILPEVLRAGILNLTLDDHDSAHRVAMVKCDPASGDRGGAREAGMQSAVAQAVASVGGGSADGAVGTAAGDAALLVNDKTLIVPVFLRN
jgi:hypothetical protein